MSKWFWNADQALEQATYSGIVVPGDPHSKGEQDEVGRPMLRAELCNL